MATEVKGDEATGAQKHGFISATDFESSSSVDVTNIFLSFTKGLFFLRQLTFLFIYL